MAPDPKLGVSCPKGGDFFVCSEEVFHFLGCCTTDACSAEGYCPSVGLRSASFSFDKYREILPQGCDPKQNASWYTCAGAEGAAPFMGCCKENPCANGQGCAQVNLGSATLSDNATHAAPFLGEVGIDTIPAPSSSVQSSDSPESTCSGGETGACEGKRPPPTIPIAIGFSMVIVALILGMLGRHVWKSHMLKKRQEHARVAPSPIPLQAISQSNAATVPAFASNRYSDNRVISSPVPSPLQTTTDRTPPVYSRTPPQPPVEPTASPPPNSKPSSPWKNLEYTDLEESGVYGVSLAKRIENMGTTGTLGR
ncbi:hypothetical protein F4780DRAFT_226824 [Xylariomycetidae sp. FL0641]|nr:hypothetical protein F4780DRAFT_226824 [Xylariomycetidae sp. FL0641]